ncbi:MAG: ACP S-malonyltransferase [Alphaproteobacteria bacterium]|jgi:[acyl-carrier-protein] S-malonyltransferase|nr:ACP S-malonyltransferase [Alphaproteobacteria bacterium]MDP6660104.1 ACP S-malonyltransferase [Alphaproteobacteria bacterium]MDP6780532.1 ACP S-malonyltransferase [Alphaproteobacteria bacterium]MDP7044876.1 ACP S-malonyltransferase [Alphaproteobacteria bacterium]HAQ32711.1 [acyl-carrier-protein] S-malonyltransferase [Rhodospirillaceae bacterium]
MTRAFIFPGQGSQQVGMGRDLAEAFPVARHLFEEVDDALGQHLGRLMFQGPDEELVLTENAQPALMAVSMAVVLVLREEGGLDLGKSCSFVAGHSLGEYSALAAAGALELADAARLLKVRGQAMQDAVPVGKGAMAALIGLNFDDVESIASDAADGEVCMPANDNAPGQIVISGNKAAVDRALELAAERGCRRNVVLPVSAPFHCSLMKPAAGVMETALADVPLSPPVVPLVANVTAESVNDPSLIRRLLVEQVTGMVRWRESVLYMKEQKVTELVELGAGKVLSGLARRIDRDLSARSVQSPDDIEAVLKYM